MRTQVATEPMTVEQLEARLRKLVPRLGSRDKQTVLLAIEAIQDLSNRLHVMTTNFTKKLESPLEAAAKLRQRVDEQGELLSDLEDAQVHAAYALWRRRDDVKPTAETWDRFLAELRALYKNRPPNPRQRGIITDIQEPT